MNAFLHLHSLNGSSWRWDGGALVGTLPRQAPPPGPFFRRSPAAAVCPWAGVHALRGQKGRADGKLVAVVRGSHSRLRVGRRSGGAAAAGRFAGRWRRVCWPPSRLGHRSSRPAAGLGGCFTALCALIAKAGPGLTASAGVHLQVGLTRGAAGDVESPLPTTGRQVLAQAWYPKPNALRGASRAPTFEAQGRLCRRRSPALCPSWMFQLVRKREEPTPRQSPRVSSEAKTRWPCTALLPGSVGTGVSSNTALLTPILASRG